MGNARGNRFEDINAHRRRHDVCSSYRCGYLLSIFSTDGCYVSDLLCILRIISQLHCIFMTTAKRRDKRIIDV
ncbi:hypothetical protein D1872_303760 [compost metagenome]